MNAIPNLEEKSYLLDSLPPQDDATYNHVATYIVMAPLAFGHWQILKQLYKKAEALILNSPSSTKLSKIVALLLYKLDTAKLEGLTSKFPTKPTLRYMKRRGRRVLKNLLVINPEIYNQVILQLLAHYENNQSIDFKTQWIIADTLLAKSRRAKQLAHGQGDFVFSSQQYHLHQKEERYPELWDTQLALMQDILTKNFPWPIQELVIKVLERNQAAYQLSENTMEAFFASPSLVLQRAAKEYLVKNTFDLSIVSAANLSGLFLFESNKREQIKNILLQKDEAFQQKFAQNAFEMLKNISQNAKGKRNQETLVFLVNNFKKYIPTQEFYQVLPLFLSSNQNELENFAYEVAIQAPKEEATDWLKNVAPFSKETIQKIFAIFASKFNSNEITEEVLNKFIFQNNHILCEFGWELAAKLNNNLPANIWHSILFGVQRENKVFLNTILPFSLQSEKGANLLVTHLLNKQPITVIQHISLIQQYIAPVYFDKIVDKAIQVLSYSYNPLGILEFISLLPETYKDKILEATQLANETYDIFVTGSSHLANIFAKQNAWMIKVIAKFIQQHNFEEPANAIYVIIQTLFASNLPIHFQKEIFQAIVQINREDIKEKFVQQIASKLFGQMQVISALPESLLQRVLAKLPLASVMDAIANLPEATWEVNKPYIHAIIFTQSQQAGFWKMVLEKIVNTEQNNFLYSRLLENPEFYQLFLQQTDLSLIATNHPIFEQTITAWAKHHGHLFTQNLENLYKVITHKYPSLRDWGLEMLAKQTLDIPFYLRLMETELPPVVEKIKELFNNISPKSPDEIEAMLAIFDSPSKMIRRFAITYLQNRKQYLDLENDPLLQFLTEHADHEVQAIVAQEINTLQNSQKPYIQRFDKEILRIKNSSRKAKEEIKTRIATNLHNDIEINTLLELARSNAKQDAEWAIAQLTKLALAGEKIEGFEII